MSKPKSVDRNVEPEMTTFPFRLQVEALAFVSAQAKKLDRTRASIIREAVRQWIERRSAK